MLRIKFGVMVATFIISIISTSGCAVYQLAATGVQVYSNARAVSNASYANEMAKSMRNSEPIFNDYSAISVDTLIFPREGNKGDLVTAAFKDNVRYLIDQDLKEVTPDKNICSDASCQGKIMVVQFKESGYDANFIQKITIGDKLRGNLFFIDKESGTVIRKEDIEATANYEQILHMVHASVVTKLLKGRQFKDQKEAEGVVNKVNTIDPIKPEYKELLAAS